MAVQKILNNTDGVVAANVDFGSSIAMIEYDSSIGGSYADCVNKEYSERIIKAYWKRYATEKRIGRAVTDQDRARIHNGGPNGYKKSGTLKFWKKVKWKLGT